MRVTILGCGGSAGVPVIGNHWGDCDPANPRNRRTRASVLVEIDADARDARPEGAGGAVILIDTSPDLRQQLLSADVRRIDAVLWTHAHADHCHGLDELREICRLKGGPLDAFSSSEHLDAIAKRFDYCFEPLPEGAPVYRPVLSSRVVDGPFEAAGVPVIPFDQDHGYMTTLGFRIGNFAYSTDVVRLDDDAFDTLRGVDLWIVDCVREGPPHPVHSHLPQTLEWIDRVRPKRAVLTHMNHTMDYATVSAKLPPGVEMGYDGLVIELADRNSGP